MPKQLSPAAEQLLSYAFERGGQWALVHAVEAAHGAPRAGLIELVMIGEEGRMVVLTPAGLQWCRTRHSGLEQATRKRFVLLRLGEPSKVNMILGAEIAFGVACAAIFALAVTGRSNLSDWEVGNLNKIAVLTGAGAVAMAALIALRLY